MENRELVESYSTTANENHSLLLLTQAGFDNLQAELDNLTTVKRPDIAERIRESQQHGEFSEDNSELDEVKFEQAIVENRISELKAIFSHAAVIEESHIPTDEVGLGSKVGLNDLDYDEDFEVTLVSSVEADPYKGYISTESPMGTAIFGLKVGEIAKYEAPDGMKEIRIDSISK